jgi:hypothetical protein
MARQSSSAVYIHIYTVPLRQYSYFCTSKSRKLSTRFKTLHPFILQPALAVEEAQRVETLRLGQAVAVEFCLLNDFEKCLGLGVLGLLLALALALLLLIAFLLRLFVVFGDAEEVVELLVCASASVFVLLH